MKHAILVSSAFIIALACAGPLNAAQWRKLATPRYTIITHASDRLTRSVASDFDDFLGLLDRIVVVKPDALRPLTIVLFADDSEFDPFKPLTPEGTNIDYVSEEEPGVRTTSVIGSQNGWTAIGVAAQEGIAGQDYNNWTRKAVSAGGVM